MKKVLSLLLIVFIFVLSGCEQNFFKDFNKQLLTITPESTDFILLNDFSITKNGETHLFKDLVGDLLAENDIQSQQEPSYLDLKYLDRKVYSLFTYQSENGEYPVRTLYKVLISIDLDTLETELIDILEPVTTPEYSALWTHQNHIIVVNTELNILSSYINIDGSYEKKNHQRPASEYSFDDFYEGIYFRYKNATNALGYQIVDAYDFINESEYYNYAYLNNAFAISTPRKIDHHGNLLTLSSSETYSIILTNESNEVVFENRHDDLFNHSNVGLQINELLDELNLDVTPTFLILTSEKSLFLIVKYTRGFMFNASLFGETPNIVFKLDIENETLIYLGSFDYILKLYDN